MKWWMQLTGAAAAAAVAFFGGRLAARPQERVVEKIVTQVQYVDREVEKKVEVQGPVRIVDRWRTLQPATLADGTWRCTIDHERVTEKGVVRIETALGVERRATEASRTEIDVAPAPRASWAAYGGWRLEEKRASVGLDLRLFGSPLWISARTDPLMLPRLVQLKAPPIDVGLRVEF